MVTKLIAIESEILILMDLMTRRYIAKDRQRYLEEELEKRRQRGKFIEW